MARSVWSDDNPMRQQQFRWMAAIGGAVGLLILGLVGYGMFVIDVPARSVAVLTRLTGNDLANGEEVAPDSSYKGVQQAVLSPGRHFVNPYDWEWKIEQMTEVPEGKIGVEIRLFGDNLPYGDFLAAKPGQKGIVPGYLKPGLHAVNKYITRVELHSPIVIPAGYQGVVTNLSGPLPMKAEDYDFEAEDKYSKQLLVKPGFRGVLRETKNEGSHPVNPYEMRINLVDCRSQRFNLGEEGEIGFPSKDGFWVSLDGIVEFRINPKKAALVYVIYNEYGTGPTLDKVDEEIVKKIIMPTARSFCRLQGSNTKGRDFMEGRATFQEGFQRALRTECEPLGIEIIQALITRITPPAQIAKPVRERELARQKEKQYQQQTLQQLQEEKLAVEKELVLQKQAVIQAEQDILKVTVLAERDQEVAVTKAMEEEAVAKLKLEAAKDEAAAILTRGKGAAEMVRLANKAEAAGWTASVQAFGGDGGLYAQYVLYQKISGAYRSIMINTADSPIMKIFEAFNKPGAHPPAKLPESGETTAGR